MEKIKRLPDSELDIMLAVWEAGEHATAPQIMDALERPLTASALHSYLKRLEEKDFLSCEKEGRTNVYTPLVKREAYERREGKSVLGKLYAGSLSRFAAALYDGGALSQTDLRELREFLDTVEGEGAP